MAFEVRLTRRATRDLRHIYIAIEAQSSLTAAKWFLGLEATILSLENLPARGQATPEQGNLRHLLYGERPHIYRIIYSMDENTQVVNIVQVRHGAQRPLRSI